MQDLDKKVGDTVDNIYKINRNLFQSFAESYNLQWEMRYLFEYFISCLYFILCYSFFLYMVKYI